MKTKIKKYLMVIMMAAGMLFSAAMPAYAYTGGAEQADTSTGTISGNISVETEDTEEAPITEEPSDTERAEVGRSQGRVRGTPFSVSGNGQSADDIPDDGSKQFLTVQTKNGNTFFMVLDRSNDMENVYMLSMIDEDDLAEFIGETQERPETEQPSVVIPETETPSVTDGPEAKKGAEEEKGGMNTGALLAVIVLLAGGIGGCYYLKVLRPRQDEDKTDGEDLEFYDGGEYINEDQGDPDEEGADE